MKTYFQSYIFLALSISLGIFFGIYEHTFTTTLATTISTLFMHFLSMLAAPIVFLAVVSTLLNIEHIDTIKQLGRRVATYTFLTTILASLVALFLFLLIHPISANTDPAATALANTHSYLDFVTDIIPSNITVAFSENKVISLVFLGFLLGLVGHSLPEKEKNVLRSGFSALFNLFLKVAELSSYIMPVAIWAFTTQLTKEVSSQGGRIHELWAYLFVVVSANILQGVVVIPILLKLRGLSPLRIIQKSYKPLLVAFFTKSSNTALPVAMKTAEEKLNIAPHVARFSLPVCTVINMNGCAAFILTTVLFVAGSHGHVFTPFDYAFWVLMSVFAAVGNAGVPMGCFFLSSAFLISMDVPLTTMGKILPFYAVVDMIETALNVWSDMSVTTLVDKDYAGYKAKHIKTPLSAIRP